jgi:Protein of unknown function (DUF2568)
MAVVWGLFLAPKRRIDLAKPLRLAIEFVVFGAASAGLAATGQTALAIAFAIVGRDQRHAQLRLGLTRGAAHGRAVA